MAKISNKTKRILKYLDQGMRPRDVANKMHISVHDVYNARARHRSGSETGITSLPAAVKPERRLEPNLMVEYMATEETPIENVKPSIWQRIKRVFGWQ